MAGQRAGDENDVMISAVAWQPRTNVELINVYLCWTVGYSDLVSV